MDEWNSCPLHYIFIKVKTNIISCNYNFLFHLQPSIGCNEMGRDNPRMGLIHFAKKLLMFCKNGLYFWLGPIYKLFKSHVNYALMWILRILGSGIILAQNDDWPLKWTNVPYPIQIHANFQILTRHLKFL